MSTETLDTRTQENVEPELQEGFDPQEYSPEGADQPPSETESAILTVLMFGGLVAFAAGCWLMGGFG